MGNIKIGDIVITNKYNKNVIFLVEDIKKINNSKYFALKGIFERIKIEAREDEILKLGKKDKRAMLESRNIEEIDKIHRCMNLEKELERDLYLCTRQIENIITGKILHIDGDKKYTDKSKKYYKQLGLNAIVRNIPEYLQPSMIYKLLEQYKPDILVITGHDGMIKKGIRYNDLNNYRNSKYFIETVKEARRYDRDKEEKLAIFAGACQSYYEGIILAGANFASSPGRVLIDFVDPILVAKKIALTHKSVFITIGELESELKEGKKGIDGVGSNGKMTIGE